MTAEQALDLAEEKAKQIKRELKPLADGKMCHICGSDSSHLCYVSKDDDVWAECLRCGSRVLIKENGCEFEPKQADGDLISRQDAIEFFKDDVYVVNELKNIATVAIPSKTGHWIYDRTRDWDGECKYECSECGMGSDVDYDYCMRCGARMESEG